MVHKVGLKVLGRHQLNSHEPIQLHCVNIPSNLDHFGGKSSKYELKQMDLCELIQ